MTEKIRKIKGGGDSNLGLILSVSSKGMNRNNEGGQNRRLVLRNKMSKLKAPNNNLQNNKNIDCQNCERFKHYLSQYVTLKIENSDRTVVAKVFDGA